MSTDIITTCLAFDWGAFWFGVAMTMIFSTAVGVAIGISIKW